MAGESQVLGDQGQGWGGCCQELRREREAGSLNSSSREFRSGGSGEGGTDLHFRKFCPPIPLLNGGSGGGRETREEAIVTS